MTIFRDMALCRSCVNRRFGGKNRLHIQGTNNRERGKSASRCLQPYAHIDSSLADFSNLKMEAIRSSKTSVHTIPTQRHIQEDGILLYIITNNVNFFITNISNYRMIDKWIGNDLEKKQSWPDRGPIPEFASMERGKSWKIPVRVADVRLRFEPNSSRIQAQTEECSELIMAQLVYKWPAFMWKPGNRRFIATFTYGGQFNSVRTSPVISLISADVLVSQVSCSLQHFKPTFLCISCAAFVLQSPFTTSTSFLT
jgi:hypothetical protein